MEKRKTNIFWFIFLLLCFGCDNLQPDEPNAENIPADIEPDQNPSIPAEGKLIDPDSLAKPKTIPLLRKPETIPARNTIYTADPPNILPYNDKVTQVKPGENGIPLPDTISMQQEVVIVKRPRPTPAGPMAMKPEAITDIQYLSVSQGLKHPFISGLLEDSRGNLWISNGEYLSRYDGQHYLHYGPGLETSTMLEDRNGHLWLGGDNGELSCFDGNRRTVYQMGQEELGFQVISMMEDRKGQLWFGTYRGVFQYNPSARSPQPRFVKYSIREGLIGRRVGSMVEDHTGRLWFGTDKGLSCFDGKRFTNYPLNTTLNSDDFNIRSIIEDSQGFLWIGTNGIGLLRFDPSANAGEGSFAKINIPLDGFRGLMEDYQGNIWASIYRTGLFCIFRNGPEIGKRYARYTQNEGLNGSYFRAMIKDSHGNIWIGGQNGGVSRINIRNPIRYYNQENGLKGNDLDCIFEDSRGFIWFGMASGAIQYNAENGGSFTKYGTAEGLQSNGVTSLMEDRKGNLWMGSWRGNEGNIAIRFNLFRGKESFTYYNQETGLSNRHVLSMLKDSRGNLWFGDDEHATYYEPDYSGGGPGRFIHYPLRDAINMEGSDFLEDRTGHLWIAAGGVGVYKFDLNLSKLEIDSLVSMKPKASQTIDYQHWTEGQTYTIYTTKDGLANDQVRDIMQDSRGMLWFATINGLSRFDPVESRFYRYDSEDGLLSDNLKAIAEDQQHRIWVFSQSGINVLVSVQSGNFNGRSPGEKDYQIFTFSEADGFYTVDGGFKSLYVTSQNQLWWATGNGVASLDLNHFDLPSDIPKINLNSIDIDQTYIDFSGFQDSAYQKSAPLMERLAGSFDSLAAFNNYPLNLKLPYELNHLTFHYSAIDWNSPHQLQYSYMMEGLDKTWSELTSDIKADYRNLPAGSYAFKVKAIGASKIWSQEFEYPFRIRPPWWETWWAYVVYLFMLILVGYRVHLYQKKRTIRIEREKTRERELLQAQEIEKAYTELKSTQSQLIQSEKMASLGELTAGIAHEIQNPLNFVNNFSEVNQELVEDLEAEIEKGNNNEIKTILENIRENEKKVIHHGKRADAIVKSMLQHSRVSSGEKELTDINALCDEYLRLAYHGLRAKDKSFNATFKTELDSDLPKIKAVPQGIGRVLLNLINNAFQATSAETLVKSDPNYHPQVIVSTKAIPLPGGNRDGFEGIEITVSDNGPGIADGIKDKIFQPFFTTKPTGQGTGLGLSLAYDIVKAHGGELKVESEEGKGTKFLIQLPIV